MSETWVRAAVGLGSNLGEREALLASAVRELTYLNGVRNLRAARPIETAPVGGPSGQGPYLNAAVVFETRLAPRELLGHLQRIEVAHGRDRASGIRNAARTLDLDLLLHGDSVIREDGLCVPHPRMHEREFVLRPLSAIAPDLVVPTRARSVRELLRDAERAHGIEFAR